MNPYINKQKEIYIKIYHSETTENQRQEKDPEIAKEKYSLPTKEQIKMTGHFLIATVEAGRQQNNIFKV